MKSPLLNRRLVLKGIGTAAVGLPLLEEMLCTSALAASPEVPTRAFNVFFGLGIPAPLQQEGYDGVLEPLKPLKEKLLIMRGIDQVRCDENGINAHFDGAAGAFTAEPPSRRSQSWRTFARSSDPPLLASSGYATRNGSYVSSRNLFPP